MNILLALIPLFAFAGGTDVGRGGDSIALDFKSVANYDLAVLRAHSSEFAPLVEIGRLENVVASAALETQDHVFLGSVEKDAVNISNPDRIVIGSERWRALPLFDPRKDALVLHEYVSLLGIDDSGYAVSSKLLAVLAKTAQAPQYSCTLVQDPKMMPAYRDTTRVGGAAGPNAALGADRIRAQLFVNAGGDGSEVLITLSDSGTQIGMLELPHTGSFPPSINLYARDLQGTLWQITCIH